MKIHLNYGAARRLTGGFLFFSILLAVLLQPGCSLVGGLDGKTPLMAAADKGDLPRVKRLITRGKDPSRASPQGRTALMEAAEAGHLAIVQYLVEKGAALNAAHRHPIGLGNGYGGRTALEKATARKHAAIAQYLMEKGAVITPFALIRMIGQGGELSAIALARVDDPRTAQSVLTGVLRMGKWDVAERLLKVGANTRQADPSGNTPTHWAAGWGGIAAMGFLLRHGASINTTNRFGKTPLDNAAGRHRLKMIEFMLANGANIRAGAPLASALRNTARKGQDAWTILVVRVLLRRGADVNRADPQLDETPLMRAARAGSLELVKLLVRSGADVNRKNRSNHTALLFSRLYRRPQVETYLLRRTARIPKRKTIIRPGLISPF